MKLRNLLSAAALSVGLFTSSAQAAVLDLTELLSFSSGGFSSSMIHDQRWSRMSGAKPGYFDSAITGGTFDTASGVIKFMGTISKNGLSSSFTAMGNLMASATRTAGLHGNINFSFTGDILGGRSLNFLFEDKTYTSGKEPNGYASNSTHKYIALWGDRGNYDKYKCQYYKDRCYGVDLRIAYKDNGGGGGVVPLPASAFFLLAGIGGLGVTRKLRKKA